MSIKSVTFYYRNPNVIITNKLPDGYAVDKASGTALLNSSYEFTVTWNPEEYRTPTVKWNGVTMIPVNKEDDKATYAGKIDGDVEIVVSGRKEDLSGNTLVIDDLIMELNMIYLSIGILMKMVMVKYQRKSKLNFQMVAIT